MERTICDDEFEEEEIAMDLNDKSTYTEYVLDIIVERKTADDLAASLRDG